MSRGIRGISLVKKLPLLTGMAALSLSFLAGCSSGPSQKELGILEGRRQSMEAAETAVTERKAVKAKLERKVADKQAQKKALDERLAATKANISN